MNATIVHDIGAPCGTVTSGEILTDPEERGDVTCWLCARIAGLDLEDVES